MVHISRQIAPLYCEYSIRFPQPRGQRLLALGLCAVAMIRISKLMFSRLNRPLKTGPLAQYRMHHNRNLAGIAYKTVAQVLK
jgi:hypothetical protein